VQFQEKMDGTAQQPASLNSTHWHQIRMHLQRHQEIEQNNGMQWQEPSIMCRLGCNTYISNTVERGNAGVLIIPET
jgi:hypothetical protein